MLKYKGTWFYLDLCDCEPRDRKVGAKGDVVGVIKGCLPLTFVATIVGISEGSVDNTEP